MEIFLFAIKFLCFLCHFMRCAELCQFKCQFLHTSSNDYQLLIFYIEGKLNHSYTFTIFIFGADDWQPYKILSNSPLTFLLLLLIWFSLIFFNLNYSVGLQQIKLGRAFVSFFNYFINKKKQETMYSVRQCRHINKFLRYLLFKCSFIVLKFNYISILFF